MTWRANGQNFKGISIPAETWERIFAPKGPPPLAPLVPPTDGSVSGYTLVQMQKRWDEWREKHETNVMNMVSQMKP